MNDNDEKTDEYVLKNTSFIFIFSWACGFYS